MQRFNQLWERAWRYYNIDVPEGENDQKLQELKFLTEAPATLRTVDEDYDEYEDEDDEDEDEDDENDENKMSVADLLRELNSKLPTNDVMSPLFTEIELDNFLQILEGENKLMYRDGEIHLI